MKRVFRLPLTRRRVAAEVDQELRFHLEGRIDELVASGMTREQAATEARRRLGDLESHRRVMRAIDEEIVRMHIRRDLGDLIGRELAHSARAVRRAPSFWDTAQASSRSKITSSAPAAAAFAIIASEWPGQVSSVLRTLENVVLSPHLGASTVEAERRVAIALADRIAEYLSRGTSPEWVVRPPQPRQSKAR